VAAYRISPRNPRTIKAGGDPEQDRPMRDGELDAAEHADQCEHDQPRREHTADERCHPGDLPFRTPFANIKAIPHSPATT